MRKEHLGGLEDLWLQNGYETIGGESRPVDPNGLIRAVAQELCNARHRLSPDGIAYLRRLIDRSPEDLDLMLGLEAGSVENFENGTARMPETGSMRLRSEALKTLGDPALVEAQTLAPATKLVFAHGEAGWRCVERTVVPALLKATPPAP